MALEIAGSRTTSSAVTFEHPFHIGHDHRELPAGTYVLHAEEDVYQGAFGPVYHAMSIDLSIEALGRTTTRVVLPRDMTEALMRDQQRSLSTLPSENPDLGCAARIDHGMRPGRQTYRDPDCLSLALMKER